MDAKDIKLFDITATILVVVGGLNWGLVGFFGFDLLGAVFGEMTIVTRILYVLVGVAAAYDVVFVRSIWRRWHIHYPETVRA